MKKFIEIVFTIFLVLYNISFSQSQSDSILIEKKGIFFFGPTESELDSADYDYLEAYSDFSYYTNKIVPKIREMGFEPDYFSQRIIEFTYDSRTFFVDRDSIDFGTIFFDGINEPLILKYVLTDNELEEKINFYFKKE